MLDGKIGCVDSWCKFAGGYPTVPGGIRGRFLVPAPMHHKKTRHKKAPLRPYGESGD